MAKVFILGSYAPSLTNFRGSLIRELREAGHEVLTAAPDLEGAVRKRLESWGVRCFPVPMRRHGLNPQEDLRTLSTLVALLRRERPEVFLGYTIKPVLYGVLAARLARVPRRYAMITGLGFAFSGESLARRVVRAVAERGYRLGLGFCQRVFFQNPDDLKVFRERRLLNDPKLLIKVGEMEPDGCLTKTAAFER